MVERGVAWPTLSVVWRNRAHYKPWFPQTLASRVPWGAGEGEVRAGVGPSVWAVAEECSYLKGFIFDLNYGMSYSFSPVLRPDRHHQDGWKGLNKGKPEHSSSMREELVAGVMCVRSAQASHKQWWAGQPPLTLFRRFRGSWWNDLHSSCVLTVESWRAGFHLGITVCIHLPY